MDDMAKSFLDRLNKLSAMDDTELNIKDNKIYFKHNDVQYRIRKPVYKEKKAIDQTRIAAYNQCLLSKVPFEKQLIESLKINGEDVSKIEKTILDLETKKKTLYIELATETDDATVEALQSDIYTLSVEQVSLSVQKSRLLSASLEYQVWAAVVEMCVFLLLEKEQDDQFVKVFDKREDFDNCQDVDLIEKASYLLDELGVINRA